MCAIQRVRVAENRIEMQAVKWTAEGIVKGIFAEYSMTCGTRKLLGICLYPVECAEYSAKQGGTAEIIRPW